MDDEFGVGVAAEFVQVHAEGEGESVGRERRGWVGIHARLDAEEDLWPRKETPRPSRMTARPQRTKARRGRGAGKSSRAASARNNPAGMTSNPAYLIGPSFFSQVYVLHACAKRVCRVRVRGCVGYRNTAGARRAIRRGAFVLRTEDSGRRCLKGF